MVGVVVVVVGAAALVAVLLTRHSGGAASTEPGGVARTAVNASPGQAQRVAAALETLTTDPASLVASGARTEAGGRAAQGVPRGSKITPDPGSWEPDGMGGGVMTVTVASPGQPPVSYAAVMVNENGAWRVLATMKLAEATHAPAPATS
jgi:hypothetical protein